MPNAQTVLSLVTASPARAETEPRAALYAIDPGHASAQFKVRHLMVSNVRGELGEVSGDILLDDRDPSRSSVVARVDATAINTRNPDRDAHLKSADFLDVANHPVITFRSTSVGALAPGRFRVEGELTIRGTARTVALETEITDEIRDPWGNVKRGVVATTRIDRKAFGVSWHALMDGGGIVVADAVEVTIEAEIVRKAG